MDKRTKSGDGAAALTACNLSTTLSSGGPKIIASSTKSSPRATTNRAQDLYRRRNFRHHHRVWNTRGQPKMSIMDARGQQAGGRGARWEQKNHDAKTIRKVVKFSPSAKTDDSHCMLKRKVCNIVEYGRNTKRRFMKTSFVAPSQTDHPSRSSTSPDDAVQTTAAKTSDFTPSTLLDDLTFAVRVLQRKIVMGGDIVVKRVISNQAAPYPSLQQRQEWKGKPKSKIYKMDAARRAAWILEVVVAVRFGHEVPGYAQWREQHVPPPKSPG